MPLVDDDYDDSALFNSPNKRSLEDRAELERRARAARRTLEVKDSNGVSTANYSWPQPSWRSAGAWSNNAVC